MRAPVPANNAFAVAVAVSAAALFKRIHQRPLAV